MGIKMRKDLALAAISLGLLVAIGLVASKLRKSPERSPQEVPAAAAYLHQPTVAVRGQDRQIITTPLREVSIWDTNVRPKVAAAAPPIKRPPRASAAQPTTGPHASSAVAQQAMTQLTQLVLGSTSLTKQQADQINGLLAQLVGEGAGAVPSILDFLKQNLDVNFSAEQGGDQVSYATLRLGLIDVLQQIGGAEADDAMAATLQLTSDPLEVAQLSRDLEKQAPGQYRQMELTAAAEVLTQASTGNSVPGDMSSVFELMQAYGDTNVVSELANSVTQWNYYATLALAGLPDGAGIPALIKLAQDPAISSMGTGDFALRPLAQVALQYPEAAQALVGIASQNQIPDNAWAAVGAALAGNYIQYGNQMFGSTSPPADWSAAQVNQRISLVNQLLSVTGNPAGRTALQNALTSLSTRLPQS
jgi:hypothetical protein